MRTVPTGLRIIPDTIVALHTVGLDGSDSPQRSAADVVADGHFHVGTYLFTIAGSVLLWDVGFLLSGVVFIVGGYALIRLDERVVSGT